VVLLRNLVLVSAAACIAVPQVGLALACTARPGGCCGRPMQLGVQQVLAQQNPGRAAEVAAERDCLAVDMELVRWLTPPLSVLLAVLHEIAQKLRAGKIVQCVLHRRSATLGLLLCPSAANYGLQSKPSGTPCGGAHACTAGDHLLLVVLGWQEARVVWW
jgi:hypothetical protein